MSFFLPSSARVKNLSSVLRFCLKLLQLIVGLLSSRTAERLTPSERAAIAALQTAIEAVLLILPAPGVDDNPATPD